MRRAFRGFYQAYPGHYERARKKLRHCDLYVVRLLPEGRQFQGTAARDLRRLGFSQPCVRCLRALEAAGVQRIVFSTGLPAECPPDSPPSPDAIGYEVSTVAELLAAGHERGHSSRGDLGAVACGALRRDAVCGRCD